MRGLSLIARAGRVLSSLDFIDLRVISTDSETYAEEGRRFGLEAPFLRPADLATDQAIAVDVLRHALREVERDAGRHFDVVLVVEPTSPLRAPDDIEGAARLLLEAEADSVITVSPVPARFHPQKLLILDDSSRLGFLDESGRSISARQQLEGSFVWRNGVCYAVRRDMLLAQDSLFTERTLAYVINRPVVNVDEPLDLAVAELLLHPGESAAHRSHG